MRISRIADFGGKLSGRKPIDVNLSAIRSRRGPGQRLQLRLQLVRIVRQSVEILALQYDGAGAALRTDANSRCLFLHLDVLLLHRDLQLDIELLDLAGLYLHFGFIVDRESFRSGSDVVRARAKAIDLVNALMVGLNGDGFATGTGGRDRGLRNDRTGRIRNPSPHGSRSSLRRERCGTN